MLPISMVKCLPLMPESLISGYTLYSEMMFGFFAALIAPA